MLVMGMLAGKQGTCKQASDMRRSPHAKGIESEDGSAAWGGSRKGRSRGFCGCWAVLGYAVLRCVADLKGLVVAIYGTDVCIGRDE